MCSLFRSLLLVGTIAALTVGSWAKPLVFCADPANTPFSNRTGTGFENRIANVLGRELKTPVEFYWARMGRGFVRNVVNAGECDALLGVPRGMHGLLVTRPYYRSTYVFVTAVGHSPISSFDDPRLKRMRIGVQVLDDDYAPPARALSRRGLSRNIVGFEMEDGGGEIVNAVANRKVDVAVVWGPIAGFYAAKLGRRVRLTAVSPAIDTPMLPFAYDIAIGVRKDAPELQAKLQSALDDAGPEIQKILRQYNVPLLALNQTADEAHHARP